MKKVIMPFACAMALISIVSCGDSSSSTVSSTDSSSSSESSVATSSASEGEVAKTSYMDLSSGSSVEVRKDSITGYYVNTQTNEPIQYYVDPATADTFDRSGRVVNNALSKGPDGKYIVDESKIEPFTGKMKTQSDGDIKIKDGDTKVKLETDGDGKIKTEDSKVKIRDGETKVKSD